jgi:hypothetical protein
VATRHHIEGARERKLIILDLWLLVRLVLEDEDGQVFVNIPVVDVDPKIAIVDG